MDTGRVYSCPLHQETVTPPSSELCRINHPGPSHSCKYFPQRHVYTGEELARSCKGVVFGLEESVNSQLGSGFRLGERESCSAQRCIPETIHRHPADTHILEVGKTFTQVRRFTCSSPNSLVDTDYDIMILPNSR